MWSSTMNSKILVLTENLLYELNDAESKREDKKTKNILALKLLDESHLQDGEQPKTVKEVSKLLDLSEKMIYKLIDSIEADDGTLEDRLYRKKHDGLCRAIKNDSHDEATAIQIACSESYEGAYNWTIRLVAKNLVKLDIFGKDATSAHVYDSPSNNLKLHKSLYWKIPSKTNASFVAVLEHLIDLYNLPYNEKEPVICLDETTRQLFSDVKQPSLPSLSLL